MRRPPHKPTTPISAMVHKSSFSRPSTATVHSVSLREAVFSRTPREQLEREVPSSWPPNGSDPDVKAFVIRNTGRCQRGASSVGVARRHSLATARELSSDEMRKKNLDAIAWFKRAEAVNKTASTPDRIETI